MTDVLLVDDTATARDLVRLLLEVERDWRVVGEASDGEQAQELAAALQPDVIVLDQEMPRMTGLAALPGLRVRCPGARIVMWSSQSDLRAEALAGGADAYVDKGASPDELLEAMQG